MWLALVAFSGLLIAIYWPVLRDLISDWWSDPNYSHGFLVPVFSGYLVWLRRKELATLPLAGRWMGLLVLLAGLGELLLGDLAAENFLMRSSLIVLIVGLVLFHLGRAWLRALAFPIVFLVFMVPLPATVFFALAFPLQSFAAQNAAWILDLLGVPVLLDGNVIHLSQLSLGVTEACSGIRSLISLMAVAVAWAALMLPGVWPMVALVAATVPIAVVANAGRVVATGLIGQWFGADYARGAFHSLSGWIIFVVAFACLLGVHAGITLILARRQRTARR